MDEEFKFHIRACFMDFLYFSKRYLSWKDYSFDSYFFPEFHLSPVRIICLDAKVKFCIWILFSNHSYKPRIRHYESIRLEFVHFPESFHERLDLKIMCIYVCREINLFSSLMTIINSFFEIIPSELVFSGTKRKHRHSGVHCISSIRYRIFHFF